MDCDELYISLLFPPSDYVSGINVFKRIINNKRPVDVFQLKIDSQNNDFNDYINEVIYLDEDCELDTPLGIFDSVKKSIGLIRKDYKKIYSRSWVMNNHFIALEYKLSNPSVFWTAEFSDPLILNLSNNVRKNKKFNVKNKEYIDRINNFISKLNGKNNDVFPLIENNSSVFYLTEYLTYLFADKIVFTNENQREMMLNQFPDDVKEFAFGKSKIQMHSTLDNKFYHIKNAEIDLDEEKINLAYFGRDYYGQRHFESLFYAVETLNHEFKDCLRIHIFVEDDRILKKLVKPLKSKQNFIINKPLDYFDFLNATTKFDVLIVNDVMTKDSWPINPYLPSKISDYLGSTSNIWALYEDGSTLSKFDLMYKSDISDFFECRNILVKILKDYGFDDENYSVNEDYFLQRLTMLNKLYESEFKRSSKLKKENKVLKKENNKILSSNSWKLTKPLRDLRNKK